MEIDFASLGQQAMDMATSDSGTPATPPANTGATTQNPLVTSTTVVPGSEHTPSQVPPTPQTPATPVQPAADSGNVVDLGNGIKLTPAEIAQKLAEAEAYGLRQADYTRKTQELARQRQEVETIFQQLQQRQAELQQQQQGFRPQQPNQQQQPQQQLSPDFDPNQPMTLGQAQVFAQAIQQRFAQLQSQPTVTADTIREEAQKIVNDRMEVARYAETVNNTLSEIYKEKPILKAFPELDDVIRYRVAILAPTSEQEAIAAFKTISNELAANIESQFNVKTQQLAAQRATLAAQGIEPPGGAAPQQPKQNYRKDNGDLDWDKLKNAAVSLTTGN